MTLQSGSNRELVYKALSSSPMTLKQLEAKLPKKVSALRTVLYQLGEAGLVSKAGEHGNATFVRSSKPKKQHPNFGIAAKIDAYLKTRIGRTIEQHTLRKDLKIGDAPINSKLSYLKKQGKIEYDRNTMPASIIVLPSMADDIPIGKSLANQPMSSLPTPPALTNESILHAALDTQPLDIAGLMHRVTQIDQQNKIYRNALEQIVSILEQARIIETQK